MPNILKIFMFIEILFQKSYISRNTATRTNAWGSLQQAYFSFAPKAIYACWKLYPARPDADSIHIPALMQHSATNRTCINLQIWPVRNTI
jgi:hypothetical protein